MLSATSWALTSGSLVSSTLTRTLWPHIFSICCRMTSTSRPPLPMMIPGLAVEMVTVTVSAARSICTSEIAALFVWAMTNCRTLMSSMSSCR